MEDRSLKAERNTIQFKEENKPAANQALWANVCD
jgi:hypothetical protein